MATETMGIFKFDNDFLGSDICSMRAGSLFGGVGVKFPVPFRKLKKKLYKGGRGIHILFSSDEGELWRVIVKQERRGRQE